MSVRIESPYVDGAHWLKGNLHTHTTESDGARAPQEVVDVYASRGYGFLMISDHDRFTDPSALDARGMVMIPGSEVTAHAPHMLAVGVSSVYPPREDRQNTIDSVNAQGGLAVMCHPNWERDFNHCPQETLERLDRYAGIEVCNGICLAVEGSGYATDRWDMLLSSGRRVWGYGNDDCHAAGTEGVAWTMAQCAERSPAAVVEALRNGRCYVSTGVAIDRIAVAGGCIGIEAPGAQCIHAYGNDGHRVFTAAGPSIAVTIPDDFAFDYVRFELHGWGDSMAWTQPFFVTA